MCRARCASAQTYEDAIAMAQKREREVKSVFDEFDLDGSNTVEISEVRSRPARGSTLGGSPFTRIASARYSCSWTSSA